MGMVIANPARAARREHQITTTTASKREGRRGATLDGSEGGREDGKRIVRDREGWTVARRRVFPPLPCPAELLFWGLREQHRSLYQIERSHKFLGRRAQGCESECTIQSRAVDADHGQRLGR
jgi:hypothetical protein